MFEFLYFFNAGGFDGISVGLKNNNEKKIN